MNINEIFNSPNTAVASNRQSNQTDLYNEYQAIHKSCGQSLR